MKKPNRRDISIEACINLGRVMSIEALTENAVIWMKENASEFGNLRDTGIPCKWSLWVYNGYDYEEVISYLLTKWDCDEYDNRR